MDITRREFIAGTAGALATATMGTTSFALPAPGAPQCKFLLMSDTHIESDFLERGREVYTSWRPGDYAALEATYKFINDDPYCREAQFALLLGDQLNTGYSWAAKDMEDERQIYFRTLRKLDLYGKTVGKDVSDMKFRYQGYRVTQNLGKGNPPIDFKCKPLDSRVIAIQGNHDTGVEDFYRECAFQCGGTRFITFFASYVGLPAPKGQYRSTGKISDRAIAFIESEMAAAAADPEINHIVLACHWAICDDPNFSHWPLMDACKENGMNNNRQKLLSLAAKYGCDLFLNGHEHNSRWPLGKAGIMADINCGSTYNKDGSFAIVEIHRDKAVFNVYSRAVAVETKDADGKVSGYEITQMPSLNFTREIPLNPIR